MASPYENVSAAVFCDFENVALGVRDAKYEKFDIKRVLERLLLKGSIVVKKAYCDWDRYKGFKDTMHEANFELIEIPHIRQSGKNSADIRLVVDALDLCYTKSHVNTFVIISGDSDFSPLVSKLRENAKQVIGVGVKKSTSDLLIANCDEFIFYDDLVRESQRAAAKRPAKEQQAAAKQPSGEEQRRKEELEARKSEAIEIAVDTFDALVSERGDSGKIWASTLKQAIKRRKPGFNESYYGFRAFGNLLEEAQARGLLELGRDEKSGAYVYRPGSAKPGGEPIVEQAQSSPPPPEDSATVAGDGSAGKPARQGRRTRKPSTAKKTETGPSVPAQPQVHENQGAVESETNTPEPPQIAVSKPQVPASEPEREAATVEAPAQLASEEMPADKKPARRKSPTGSRRPRKPKTLPDAA
ncbi:MAG TPA: NYN domain-containing protein [Nitrosospira sp.]|nr:NYN domain-containing protein [Nitrosospira sp.]